MFFVESTERRCRIVLIRREFRVGRPADVLYVQFHAHVISNVKTKISGRRRKRYFTATDIDGSRLGDWKGLRRWAQEEGLCFIIVKFKFVFQHPGLDVWQTGFQRQYCRSNVRWRDRHFELSIVREKLRLNRVTLNQVRKRFCVEDEENWTQHGTLWHTIEKACRLWDVAIDDDWLCSICQIRRKSGACSTGMPYMCLSLLRSMQWSVVSRAAERSKSVRRETLPESSARRMSIQLTDVHWLQKYRMQDGTVAYELQ